MRKAHFEGSKRPSAPEADKIFRSENPVLYKAISTASSQRIGQIVDKSWVGYFEALKSWRKSPSAFTGKPKPPKYAKTARTFTVGRNGFRISEGHLHISGGKKIGWVPIRVICCEDQPFNEKKEKTKVRDVRIVPMGTCFMVELVYDKEAKHEELNLDATRVASIDMGVNNLMAIATNQPDVSPVLVNGQTLKSMNAQWNKHKSQLQEQGKAKHIRSKVVKRHNQISDYFHKTSTWLINWCIEHRIGKIVIGQSKGWKNGVNIGRKNNQTFVSLPHFKLIGMIKYKAEEFGIEVITREESYTSKASALDLDHVPDYDPKQRGSHRFSGRRVKRGLYKTASGRLVNADINGAWNILRKEIGDEWLTPLLSDKGRMDRPIRIKHICSWLEGCHRAPETMSNSLN